MMTRTEQRRMVTEYGASQLDGTSISVLRALIDSNKLKGRNDDAEMAFRVGLSKLRKRTGRTDKTLLKHIRILEEKQIIAVIKGKAGKSNTYVLQIGNMATWDTVDETETLKRQQRQLQQLTWKHRDKAWKNELAEMVFTKDGNVKGVREDETNWERRRRLERLLKVTVI
jgi:DNA-binding MarR family transcriptional regulator